MRTLDCSRRVSFRWLLLMNRFLIVTGIVLNFIFLAPTLLFSAPPSPAGITKSNFDRIEKGMTMAEVEAIFGGPPNLIDHPLRLHKIWFRKDKACAFIEFREGKVSDMQWRPSIEEAQVQISQWCIDTAKLIRTLVQELLHEIGFLFTEMFTNQSC